eukprot:5868623-Amphidinium_carterae.1
MPQSGQRAPGQEAQLRPYVPPVLPNTVATIENVEHISPINVAQLLAEKRCTLIDVRAEDRAAGLIDGAEHVPAVECSPEKVPSLLQRFGTQEHHHRLYGIELEELVLFFCQYSAHRAPQCANWYRLKAAPVKFLRMPQCNRQKQHERFVPGGVLMVFNSVISFQQHSLIVLLLLLLFSSLSSAIAPATSAVAKCLSQNFFGRPP